MIISFFFLKDKSAAKYVSTAFVKLIEKYISVLIE